MRYSPYPSKPKASAPTQPAQGGQAPLPLEIHDLTVAYDKKPVLYGIDASIPHGKLIGIIGPNGAGKSTLIKTIMGITPPNNGWVKIFGQPCEQALNRVGYMPQRETIDWDFPVNVFDVVLMGCYGRLGLGRRPSRQDCEIVRICLERVDLLPLAKRQIANLSGGQQQRLFLARALAQQSDLYLMDEPFAGVDAATEETIMTTLRELKAQGKTLLVVHHDLATASRYFDMLLLLNMRLIGFGPTDEVFNTDMLQKTYGRRLTLLSEIADASTRQQT